MMTVGDQIFHTKTQGTYFVLGCLNFRNDNAFVYVSLNSKDEGSLYARLSSDTSGFSVIGQDFHKSVSAGSHAIKIKLDGSWSNGIVKINESCQPKSLSLLA
ncbi:hypothetical protein [Vibrio sp. D431a]|uniref:hypothetical protein n=1 Tax=Vibrio sp. D431a TaxID=2837388 RepID=UPI002553B388|nr:hypothetical protein [Vibrio sp. D431a]MDK9793861.1 hypothetical protein [Vibrio sp. D431a]